MPTLVVAHGGHLVKTLDGWHLVVRRLRMFRLVEVSVADPRRIGRYWCYSSFEAAVLAAIPWGGEHGTEPVGWVRRGGARA